MNEIWTVGLTKPCIKLAEFPTHDDAAEFINLLVGHEDGRYYIDGPVLDLPDSVEFFDYDGGVRARQDGTEGGTFPTKPLALLSLRIWQTAEVAVPALTADDRGDMVADLAGELGETVRDFLDRG